MIRFSFFLLLLAGCASYKVRDDYVASADRLFPDGVYRHDVTLTLPEGKVQHFSGVVKLAPRRIEIVGLSFIGSTVFRLIDDFTGAEPQVEIYVSALEKYRDRVVGVYGQLKRLLLMPAKGRAKEITTDEPDERGIPRRLKIDGEKFKVEVRVTGYEI